MASLLFQGCSPYASANGVVYILCCQEGIISERSFAEPGLFDILEDGLHA